MVNSYPGCTFVACDSVADAQATFIRGPPKFHGIWRTVEPTMARPTPGYGPVARVGEPVISCEDVDRARGASLAGGRALPRQATAEGGQQGVHDMSDLITPSVASIDIPVDQDLTAAALAQLNLGHRSSSAHVPPASLQSVSGLTDDTATWRTIATPTSGSVRSSGGGSSSSRSNAQRNQEGGTQAWVVIRGKRPGVYQTRCVIIRMLSSHPD